MSKITNILKSINKLPFNLTIRHYQNFGSGQKLRDDSLMFVESWDTLRSAHPHFSIPDSRDAWRDAAELRVIKDGQDKGMIERAKDVVDLLNEQNIDSLLSVGCGAAGLEYQILKYKPDLNLVCSEYSQRNVDILKKVFTECEKIVNFDIIKGDWSKVGGLNLASPKTAVLIYRLDAGFTDRQWKYIFENLHKAGVENVIYIPTTLLTALSIWNRKWRELKWFFKDEKISFAGYLRTRKRVVSFWDGLYKSEQKKVGGLTGFILKILHK